MPKLDHVVIVFEPEAACRDHLVKHGYPDDLAREVATYLAQARNFLFLVVFFFFEIPLN